MPKPGAITAVSEGSLQQIYRPQIRVYYLNARYGVLFETLTKPLRCRSRKRGVELARAWIKSPEGQEAIKREQASILENPENSIPTCAG